RTATRGKKAPARQRPQCRTVILRPRPAQDVDRAVGVETRLAEQRIAGQRADIPIAPQEFAECGITPSGMRVEVPQIEPREAQAERDEILEMPRPTTALGVVTRMRCQFRDRTHDDRG